MMAAANGTSPSNTNSHGARTGHGSTVGGRDNDHPRWSQCRLDLSLKPGAGHLEWGHGRCNAVPH